MVARYRERHEERCGAHSHPEEGEETEQPPVSVEDSPDTDEEQVAAGDGNEDGDDGDRAQDCVAIGEGSD
jgi:hypothetical protein